jgi:hypothetical protein
MKMIVEGSSETAAHDGHPHDPAYGVARERSGYTGTAYEKPPT